MAGLLVIDVAALGWDLVRDAPLEGSLRWFPLQPVFPALTCTAQATLRTALPPRSHGMVANGVYAAELRKVLFWEQAASLVDGPRIWDEARRRGRRVGMMFWQQSLGEAVDLVLSPRPIHKHSGGMIQDCLSRPEPWYDELCGALGSRFNLMHYWGPLASHRSSEWIVRATLETMQRADAPDVLFTYLPLLDYDLQRFGPASAEARRALDRTRDLLARLAASAARHGWDLCVVGDYAIRPVTGGAVFPNRALREAGWLTTRSVKGRAYPDFFHSEAFAMADHEIAHVYVRDPARRESVGQALARLEGVERVLSGDSLRAADLDHRRSGDFVLVAAEGHWMAYPWWTDPREAPDYARHIDIHNKPGYDPCELFWGWPPPSVSQDTRRVRGSHGKTGAGREVACALSWKPVEVPGDHLALARLLRERLSG